MTIRKAVSNLQRLPTLVTLNNSVVLAFAAHLLSYTPTVIAALGLMHRTKLHVVSRSVPLRFSIDCK